MQILSNLRNLWDNHLHHNQHELQTLKQHVSRLEEEVSKYKTHYEQYRVISNAVVDMNEETEELKRMPD